MSGFLWDNITQLSDEQLGGQTHHVNEILYAGPIESPHAVDFSAFKQVAMANYD